MASSIKAIDRKSVHRICSGQVVLNLAVAVKELLENSLDAGATNVTIRLKEYGSELLEVTDNATGVHPDNFQALTLKHHTSKLSDFSDLESIGTFGFRGEALSSLCALSKVTIATRHESQDVGSKLEFDHTGAIHTQTHVPRQVGTTVCLVNLFCTLPVRQKEFHRNLKKEFNKMTQLLNAYCLVSTNVKITCTNQTSKGSKVTFVSTPGGSTVRQNISSVFGPKQLSNLVELKTVLPRDDELEDLKIDKDCANMFRIEGFISSCSHGAGRQTNDRQFYYINSRPCEPNKVMKAVNEVYHQYNLHQVPFVYMNISVDKTCVDVNVTPDKRQVFLDQEKLLIATVKASLHEIYEKIPSTYAVASLKRPLSFVSDKQTSDKPSLGKFSQFRHKTDTNRETNVQQKAKQMKLDDHFSVKSSIIVQSKTDHELDLSISTGWGINDSASFSTANNTAINMSNASLDTSTQEYMETSDHLGEINEEAGNNEQTIKDKHQVIDICDKIFIESNKSSVIDEETRNKDIKIINEEQIININNCDEEQISTYKEGTSNTNRINTNKKQLTDKEDKIIIEEIDEEKITYEISNKEERIRIEQKRSDDEEISNDVNIIRNEERIKIGVDRIRSDEKQIGTGEEQIGTGEERIRTDVEQIRTGEELIRTDEERIRTDEERIRTDVEQLRTGEELIRTGVELIRTGEEQIISDEEQIRSDGDQKVSGEEQIRTDEELMLDSGEIRTDETGSDGDGRGSRKVVRVEFTIDLLAERCRKRRESEEKRNVEIKFRANIDASKNRQAEEELSREITKDMFYQMKIVGQFNVGFIITMLGSDLFIVDQHATDEKYNFETLQQTTTLSNQQLVVPQNLDLTAANECLLLENIDVFKKNGFDFIVDENETVSKRVRLSAIPMSNNWIFGKEDIDELLFMLQDVSVGTMCRPSRVRSMFASRACRMSVMIGTYLSYKDMRRLIDHMAQIEQPWNCPHGRPTMRHLINLSLT